MPNWVMWIFYILIVIIMLGVLIAIHELGHLATAKMFKVYCFEYSIGMGPKLFSKKRKNGETYFSIRAVPFGGYVAMYGEPGEIPDGFEEPPAERSLESIKKWKKCVILVAGVTLNFILGLVLIYIGDSACPVFYTGRMGAVNPDKTTLTVNLDTTYDQATLDYITANRTDLEVEAKDYVLSMPVYSYNAPSGAQESVRLLGWDILVYNKDGSLFTDTSYVAVYNPSTVIDPHDIGGSVMLFPAAEKEVPASLADLGVGAVPDMYDANNELRNLKWSNFEDGVYFGLPLSFVPKTKAKVAENYDAFRLIVDDENPLFRLTINKKVPTGIGVTVQVIKAWNSWGESWAHWAEDVPTACGAIVKGFASLFTPNGWKNVSGIIGITAAMPQINAAGGARMVFFYAGMISINLAFFNLLPFPALDGWALLVTAIEGATKKKVPQKVQGIVSTVGFVLLFGFMILIAVKDIAGLF